MNKIPLIIGPHTIQKHEWGIVIKAKRGRGGANNTAGRSLREQAALGDNVVNPAPVPLLLCQFCMWMYARHITAYYPEAEKGLCTRCMVNTGPRWIVPAEDDLDMAPIERQEFPR